MIVTELPLPGLLLIQPDRFSDDRGWFMESWSVERYRAEGVDGPFVQDNLSFSKAAVIRGLHLQHPDAQGKLVTVLSGTVWDVAVDVRPGSATFGRWVGATLSAEDRHQMYIPEGFAHGFAALTDAILSYKCTSGYNPATERTLLWNDPDVGVEWPIATPVLSAKDRAGIRLREMELALSR
jgi:dTDP-4-dehydrorhamnose 3,5-epimerase